VVSCAVADETVDRICDERISTVPYPTWVNNSKIPSFWVIMFLRIPDVFNKVANLVGQDKLLVVQIPAAEIVAQKRT